MQNHQTQTQTQAPGVLPNQASDRASSAPPATVQQATSLWVSVSPSLGVFDQPLQRCLASQTTLAKWQYGQGADEPCEIHQAVNLLHQHMKTLSQPVHLLGHGLGGAVALLYARLHPERVKSLTLFAVAEQPAVTWHAHYYVQRHLVPCSQSRVLAQMAGSLFRQSPHQANRLVAALRQDLAKVPLLHSACHLESLPQGGVDVPLMICGAEDDVVVHPAALADWLSWFKPGDRQHLCPSGGHFFHNLHSMTLAQAILQFWQLPSESCTTGLSVKQSGVSQPSPGCDQI